MEDPHSDVIHLTVTNLNGDMFNFEVSEDMELLNFKALCELESGLSAEQQELQWNGISLNENDKTLKEFGLKNGEVLLLKQKRLSSTPGTSGQQPLSNLPFIDFGSLNLPGMPSTSTSTRQPTVTDMMQNPEILRQLLLARKHDMAIIKERNPELANAILNGSKEELAEVFRRQQNERHESDMARSELLKRDQFDPEVQKLIAEEIRMKNVDTNMEHAMEYSPESFGQVVMLYIDCKVNGHQVKAFVDSGAQMTIMSSQCAERCHIKHLIDNRWAGIAHGVGTQKILGRVHLGQIQIGDNYLPSSFSILENQPMDMLLGLDMLRRHQCCIDLKNNKLIIGTTNTETPFLAENELPQSARLPSMIRSDSQSMDTEDRHLAEALAKSAEEAVNKQTNSQQIDTASSSQSPPQNFPEANIEAITSHGFTREQAIRQLTIMKGNVDQALATLIALSFPSLPPK